MAYRLSGCRKCRQVGEKLCSRAARCALERRGTAPGQHGKKIGFGKVTEYGKQLREKQKVKLLYGVREKQFRRFFSIAVSSPGVTGENLLSSLERRLDNVLFRLKMASSRVQARQMIVHGHVLVNGKKVKSPSYIAQQGDVITPTERALKKTGFVENVIGKRLAIAIKVPQWLELNKDQYKGVVLNNPQRVDIKVPIEEHLIVELYSK